MQIAFFSLFSCFALLNFQNVSNVATLAENEILTLKSIDDQDFVNFEITYAKGLGNSDLVVEAKALNQQTAQLVTISSQPSQNIVHSSNNYWVCNQLNSEICSVPTSYFEDGQKIFISVGCKDCEFTIKYFYESIRSLEVGKSETVHLRAGDSKIFEVNLESSETPRNLFINSFNLKLSNYQMIVSSTSSTLTELREETVAADWKNGKQSIIQVTPLEKLSVKVVIEAKEDGVFSIEALLDNTIINLEEAVTRLDIISANSKECYHFASSKGSSYVDIKNVQGKINIIAKEDSVTEEGPSKSIQEGNSYLLPLKGQSFSICVTSEVQSAFTIQAYSSRNADTAKTYNMALLGKQLNIIMM